MYLLTFISHAAPALACSATAIVGHVCTRLPLFQMHDLPHETLHPPSHQLRLRRSELRRPQSRLVEHATRQGGGACGQSAAVCCVASVPVS